MNEPTIIESIHALTFKVRVRDAATDEVHELELRGRGPWELTKLGALVSEKGSRAKSRSLPPPDDAITLKLDNREGKGVRVAATGSGAKAWIEVQGTLLGAKWFLDARGAPIVILEDAPSIVADIENALPKVTVDTTHYIAREAEPTAVVVTAKPRERTRKPRLRQADETEKPPAHKSAEVPAPAATETDDEAEDVPEPSTRRRGDRRARGDRKSRSRVRDQLAPGLGAGNLTWESTGDADNPGLVAPWKDGQFKILHAGGDVFALFYERDREGRSGYDRLACGAVDALKLLAGERTVTEFHPHVDFEAARQLCGVAEPEVRKAETAKVEPASKRRDEDPPAKSTKEPDARKQEPQVEPVAPEPETPRESDPSDEEASKKAMEALRGLLEDMP